MHCLSSAGLVQRAERAVKIRTKSWPIGLCHDEQAVITFRSALYPVRHQREQLLIKQGACVTPGHNENKLQPQAPRRTASIVWNYSSEKQELTKTRQRDSTGRQDSPTLAWGRGCLGLQCALFLDLGAVTWVCPICGNSSQFETDFSSHDHRSVKSHLRAASPMAVTRRLPSIKAMSAW